MMRALLTCSALLAISAHAEDVRIYQTDKYGHIQYSKPSYTVRADGRVIQTDPYGNKLYSKQQYQIRGDKIVPVSALGYRQYSKPAYSG
jgi:hypothetical protein